MVDRQASRAGRISDLAFFILIPALIAVYAGFLRFQTAPFDQGSLVQSVFFAAAFTLPGWWFAWMSSWVLVRGLCGRAPLLVLVGLGYVLSLVLFRPYYRAVYDLIAVAQPWTAEMIAARRYGFDWASVIAFAKINAPGLTIWLLVNGLSERLLGYSPYGSRGATATRVEPAPAAPAAAHGELPRFLEGLGIASAGDVLHIEAEEHYLRIVTARGARLVRYRLRDAVAELPAELGLQVHRSHWVSRCAVAAAEPAGKSLVLLLGDGTRVPVSLGYREAVRQAGLVAGPSADPRPGGVATAH